MGHRFALALFFHVVGCGGEATPPAATPPAASSTAPAATAAVTLADAGQPESEGTGEGIGLGMIGTLGQGDGGTGHGFGNGNGSLGGTHGSSSSRAGVRQGATSMNGRLPPEVIQRIVRQNLGAFKLCYEDALKTEPTLTGKVTAKFVIDRAGAVSAAQDGGSDIGNAKMVSCIIDRFKKLKFPQPEGGIVTVVYPLMFTPGDDDAKK